MGQNMAEAVGVMGSFLIIQRGFASGKLSHPVSVYYTAWLLLMRIRLGEKIRICSRSSQDNLTEIEQTV